MAKAVVFKGNQQIKTNVDTPFNKIEVKFAKQDIANYVYASNSSQTIYSVPPGKVFILESYWFSGRCVLGGAGGDFNIVCSDTKVGNLLSSTLDSNQTSNLAINLSRGLRFPAGTSFTLFSGDASIRGWGGIVGYEIAQENLFYLD